MPYPCPGCGTELWVATTTDDAGRVLVDTDRFEPAFVLHVLADPQRHPQFVLPQETDRPLPADTVLLCLRRGAGGGVCLRPDDHLDGCVWVHLAPDPGGAR